MATSPISPVIVFPMVMEQISAEDKGHSKVFVVLIEDDPNLQFQSACETDPKRGIKVVESKFHSSGARLFKTKVDPI